MQLYATAIFVLQMSSPGLWLVFFFTCFNEEKFLKLMQSKFVKVYTI